MNEKREEEKNWMTNKMNEMNGLRKQFEEEGVMRRGKRVDEQRNRMLMMYVDWLHVKNG